LVADLRILIVDRRILVVYCSRTTSNLWLTTKMMHFLAMSCNGQGAQRIVVMDKFSSNVYNAFTCSLTPPPPGLLFDQHSGCKSWGGTTHTSHNWHHLSTSPVDQHVFLNIIPAISWLNGMESLVWLGLRRSEPEILKSPHEKKLKLSTPHADLWHSHQDADQTWP
jgi:hypothetical protein